MSQFIKEATFGDKRLALDALQIKALVRGEKIGIQGVISIKHDAIVSDTCRSAGTHNTTVSAYIGYYCCDATGNKSPDFRIGRCELVENHDHFRTC